MQVVTALIGAFLGGLLDEWRGTLFGAALGYALGELWSLRKRVADLGRLVDSLRSAGPAKASPPSSHQPTQVATTPEVVRTPPAREFEPAVRMPPPIPRPAAFDTVPSISAHSRELPAREFVILRLLREFFTGGNTVVRVSVAILFVGMALLLQYASEHGHLPIEARLAGGAIFAIGLLVFGWRLRKKRPGYAIATQGGATGILYLIVFFAMRTYSLLPASLAFALLLGIVVLSAALAVLQDAMWLALLGISGGFLAPILTSTGQGNHVALFAFYAVLNVGVIVIAWFKAWRPLNVVGFAFTFVIGVIWGVQQYKPALFSSTEPFLVLFFLMYVAIAILFASRQEPNLKGYVDGTIVFGVPITAFAIQSALLYDQRYALASSAVVVSALYLVLATVLWRRRSTWKLLAESFVALSVAFATLALPLALNGRWSAASWAMEGAALLWVGSRQSRLLPRLAGIALQFAAAAHFIRDGGQLFSGLPILNSTCLGALILAGASLFSARLLRVNRDRVTEIESAFVNVLFLWSLIWWLAAGIGEIDRRIDSIYEPHALLAFFAITALLCSAIPKRLDIAIARWPALSMLLVMLFLLSIDWSGHVEPFARFGWLSWPLAWTVFYFTVRTHEDMVNASLASALHVGGLWLLTVLLSRELAFVIDRVVAGAGSWPAIAWAIVPATALLALSRLARSISWPILKHRESYSVVGCGGLAVYLFAWSVITCITQNGDPFPLPYVPILNPLDLAEIYVLITALTWLRSDDVIQKYPEARSLWFAFGAVVFIWLNAVLLRTIHYWEHVPYLPHALWASPLAQASMSIFWTSLALAITVVATRRGHRLLWSVGAALIAIVVAKLVMVDMWRVGSLARIVSLLGVGLLMLAIGYFAPLPPQKKEVTS